MGVPDEDYSRQY